MSIFAKGGSQAMQVASLNQAISVTRAMPLKNTDIQPDSILEGDD